MKRRDFLKFLATTPMVGYFPRLSEGIVDKPVPRFREGITLVPFMCNGAIKLPIPKGSKIVSLDTWTDDSCELRSMQIDRGSDALLHVNLLSSQHFTWLSYPGEEIITTSRTFLKTSGRIAGIVGYRS